MPTSGSMCYEGMHRLYGENPDPSVTERLEYELEVIDQMGYVDYYLIVHDFINYAKSQGIPVGPGRGSRCGQSGGLLHRHHRHRPASATICCLSGSSTPSG